MKKNLILGLIILLVVSCQATHPKNDTEVTKTPSYTISPILLTEHILPTKIYPPSTSITATQPTTINPVVTSTMTIQSSTSTITPKETGVNSRLPITPEMIKICPSKPEVPLSDLGMDSNYRLLVIPPDVLDGEKIQTGISSISAENPMPQPLEDTIQIDNWFIDQYRTSPDGRWLTFDRFMENNQQRDIWMIPLNGDQAQIINSVDLGTHIEWISNDKGVLIGVPENPDDGSNVSEILEPLFLYDFLAHTMQKLPEKPPGMIYEIFLEIENIPYGIFYNYSHTGDSHFEAFFLYNYNKNTYTRIFEWLIDSDKANVHNTQRISISYNANGEAHFVIITERPYGFDIGENLSLNIISSNLLYDEVMQQIYLPFDFSYPETRYFPNSELLYIQPHQDSHLRDSSDFYLYDLSNNIVMNYCFTVEYFSRTQISPDGKFIEFTTYEIKTFEDGGISIGDAKEVIIMNLSNGNYSRIPNIQAIGWGMAK